MDAEACKNAGGRWDSKKKVCRFAVKRTMSNKGWILQKIGTDIHILDRARYDPNNPLMSHVGVLSEEEEGWQPKSIQISKDTLKHMTESNTSIFFLEDEVTQKKWKNVDIKRAR